MAINVYQWPPVKTIGRVWHLTQPVSVLRSAITGKEQEQSSQRARLMAEVEVPALYRHAAPASGYMDVLGKLLQGGAAVRLTGWAANAPIGDKLEFGGLSIALTATATTSLGFGAWQIGGLPPGYPLFRSGDRFKVGSTLWQAVNSARANASGVAVVRVIGTPSGSRAVTLNQNETAVFKPNGAIPSGVPQIGQHSYLWSFREVFADEVGGFTEVGAEIWT